MQRPPSPPRFQPFRTRTSPARPRCRGTDSHRAQGRALFRRMRHPGDAAVMQRPPSPPRFLLFRTRTSPARPRCRGTGRQRRNGRATAREIFRKSAFWGGVGGREWGGSPLSRAREQGVPSPSKTKPQLTYYLAAASHSSRVPLPRRRRSVRWRSSARLRPSARARRTSAA